MKIGIDIVEVKRIGKLIKNKHFLERVFTETEIDYCMKKKHKAQHFAVRFAAKEAVWKALNNNKITLFNISIINLADGKPEVLLKGRKTKNIDISLSHTDDYAAAVAVVKKI